MHDEEEHEDERKKHIPDSDETEELIEELDVLELEEPKVSDYESPMEYQDAMNAHKEKRMELIDSINASRSDD